MRIWTGLEMEWQNKGLKTMFVETSALGQHKMNIVLSLLSEQEDVQAIYFGAGRKDVKSINYEAFTNILEYCRARNIKITFETSNLNDILNNAILPDIIKKYEIWLFIRTDIKAPTRLISEIAGQLVYKLDNNVFAIFTKFEAQTMTDITTVNEGLYEQVDTLIYTSEQGEIK